ncbi:MAG: HypC/HybG/HupF family hydrogenase formation chaperone, partial [Campylobacter sp.]|nr:HypC/HybG/HupF family hydrogenase formation chaperone [Campylobacter sp.]
FAMSKIDTEQALASLELYQKIADDMSSGEIDESEGDLGLKAMSKA